MRPAPALLAVVALWGLPALVVRAAEPAPVVVLRVSAAPLPGRDAEAMPPRFALMEDGTAYIGGTSDVLTTRLEGSDVNAIEKDIDRIRKIPGLASRVDLGKGDRRYRILVTKGKPLDLTAVGDLAGASPAFRPVVSLITRLTDFGGPGLRPYRPASFALSAREEALPGGCRSWTFPVTPAQALASPQLVSAAVAETWPTGGDVASVCAGDKRYVVELRPTLPGERR